MMSSWSRFQIVIGVCGIMGGTLAFVAVLFAVAHYFGWKYYRGEKMLYPAALLGLGLVGNKYIVRGEIKEEVKGVKAEVNKLADEYSSMQSVVLVLELEVAI